jgi:isocitrate/isopropylmalate dehydrogenase
MSNVSRITVAHGDGIGPEIMNACLHIIQSAGARIETAGIEASAWESLLGRVSDQCVEIVKTETLRNFDGQAGYTLARGQ